MFWGAISKLGETRRRGEGEHQADSSSRARAREPEVEEGVRVLGEVRSVDVLDGFLQRT